MPARTGRFGEQPILLPERGDDDRTPEVGRERRPQLVGEVPFADVEGNGGRRTRTTTPHP